MLGTAFAARIMLDSILLALPLVSESCTSCNAHFTALCAGDMLGGVAEQLEVRAPQFEPRALLASANALSQLVAAPKLVAVMATHLLPQLAQV